MNDQSVRFSRDGDQFHYLRGARLSLGMLPHDASLKLIVVEAVSDKDDLKAGVEVIDLSLYFGSADPASATRVEYVQVKHSTQHPNSALTASGFTKTLKGFAERYSKLAKGAAGVHERYRFIFETNRPIADSLLGAIKDVSEDRKSRRADYLRKESGASDRILKSLVGILEFRSEQPDFLAQRKLLDKDTRAYLAGNDRNAPGALKELVTRKATSEFKDNPSIARLDVLEALNVRDGDLEPAANLIELPAKLVEREQLPGLAAEIIANHGPFIIKADSGVGKSMLTAQLGPTMPTGSRTYVYDCFGNGSYRTPSKWRHGARVGLVQLANEMAADSLCHPLIPSDTIDERSHYHAFMARVGQASDALIARDPKALLCLLLDAADNAEEAAQEANEDPSFARGLLREHWPANVRLILTARPYRVAPLDPPIHVSQLVLAPFNERETGEHLRRRFPLASDADVAEFHRLTSRNPRVQANALESGTTIHEVLSGLGTKPRTVDDTIETLLAQAVGRARDAAVTSLEKEQVENICCALATLRPFVPLNIVAATADVPIDLVRSLANELHRPLLVREGAVQFRDEPTESWFRKKYRPDGAQLSAFAGRLRPLASSSSYVAAILPELMLDAGQLNELIELTLKSEALPEDNEVAKRDVELQRLKFALKASLRAKRWVDAARLGLRAGGEAAADSRQQTLLSENTDLAARFLEPDRLVEQVSRRIIQGGNWMGSDQAYEAALLSGSPTLYGDARSKLRTAYEWLKHWARNRQADDDHNHHVVFADIVQLSWAELNLHGPQRCAGKLRRWTHRKVSFHVGRALVSQMIDAGRFEEIDELALSAKGDFGLILACCIELARVGRVPPPLAVKRALRICSCDKFKLDIGDGWQSKPLEVQAIMRLVAAAARLKVWPRPLLAKLLTRHLPKKVPILAARYAAHTIDRHVYLYAYALRAALRNENLTLKGLMTPDLKKADRKRVPHNSNADLKRFEEQIGALLPWYTLWTRAWLGRVKAEQLTGLIDAASEVSRQAELHSYSEEKDTADDIVRLMGATIILISDPADHWALLENRIGEGKKLIRLDVLIGLTRLAARTSGWASAALQLAHRLFQAANAEKREARERVDTCVSLSRALLTASEDEARQYFEQAVVVAGKIGDEALSRWESLLWLAEAAADPGVDKAQLAYRLARAGEMTLDYVDSKYFDWAHVIKGMVGLSPGSAIAICSRWIDRTFAYEGEALPLLVGALRQNELLDGRDALSLFSMRVGWPVKALFQAALDDCESEEEQQRCFDWLLRYLPFMELDPKDVHSLRKLIEERKLSASGLAELPDQLTHMALRAHDQKGYTTFKDRDPIETDWGDVFGQEDLTNVAGIKVAKSRFDGLKDSYWRESFYAAAIARVSAGSESLFVHAVSEAELLSYFSIGELIGELPNHWLSMQSVRKAIEAFARDVYRRSASNVSRVDHDSKVPQAKLAELAGLKIEDLIKEAVDAISMTRLSSSSNGMFRLVSILAKLLTPPEADAVLSYGLQLIEPALEPKDSDGEWRVELQPPSEIAEALSGYIHAALASPFASRRWQAAHLVRGLVFLRRHEILDRLVERVAKGDAGAFADGALRFYDKHALLWLVIGLARAAMESPASVSQHEDFLQSLAQRSNFHVLARGFAAHALLSLHHQGALMVSVERADELSTINQSKLPTCQDPSRPRRSRARKPEREKKFSFGLDFDRYWLSPLGQRFGLSDEEIEQRAEEVIREDWGLADNGQYENDTRMMRRYFGDDWRDTRSSLPRSDELSFYLGWHATLTLAGKLLETRPLPVPSYEEDSFQSWFEDQWLTRGDGRWLADRRDLTPVDCLDGATDGGADWPTPCYPSLGNDQLVVNGYWSQSRGDKRHTIKVHSALVSPETAHALAAALIATRAINYRIPNHAEDMEISFGQYQLKGWVSEFGSYARMDERDPWSAGINSRVAGPAIPISASIDWRENALGRQWAAVGGKTALISQVWSEKNIDRRRWRDEDDLYAEGHRLIAASDAIESLIEAENMSLLIVVEFERDRIKDRVRFEEDDIQDDRKARRILLFERGGRRTEFRYDPPPRPKARRRAGARRRR